MNNGYVRLWREITKHAVFADPELFRLFCYCILRANYRPKTINVKSGRGMRAIKVNRGEFVAGRNSLADEFHCPPSTIRNRLERLQKLGCIELLVDKLKTRIRVVNYDKYQPEDVRRGQSMDSKKDNPNGQSKNGQLALENTFDLDIVADEMDKPKSAEKDTENKKRIKNTIGGTPPSTTFVEPSLEEIQDYATTLGYSGFDAEHFLAHHQKADWRMSGGRRITNWKAAVVTWRKNEHLFSKRNGYHDPINERMVTIG